MVVIDAAKHKLDYKQSEIDHNITALKKKYRPIYDENGNQVGYREGADTLLSSAKGQQSVIKRQGTPKINVEGSPDYDPTRPEGALLYKTADDAYYPDRKFNKENKTYTIRTVDGKKITYNANDPKDRDEYEPVKKVDPRTGEVSFTNKSGTIAYNTIPRTQKSTKMAETDDAYTLVSDAKHPMELIYAEYANSMKALANQARLELARTGKIAYSESAKVVYQKEVDSLNEKLNEALLNSPRERAAQRLANAEVKAKGELDPSLKKSDLRKIGAQALTKYRSEIGSATRKERNIEITDREWEAIQAGAISETLLKKILNNTDIDKLRARATPRTTTTLSTAKINKIKSMRNSNYTIGQIAKALGVSASTVSSYLK